MEICKKLSPFEGLYQIKFPDKSDIRGTFQRLFSFEELQEYGWSSPIMQINHTKTTMLGTVRGLHFQHPPYAEKKIVFCLNGSVCDVVVDLQADSPTYLQHYKIELSSSEGCGILIPEGFAHGFQALTEDVEMLYFHSENYQPKFEDGISPLDEVIGIEWPLKVINLSDRDKNHARIVKNGTKFIYGQKEKI